MRGAVRNRWRLGAAADPHRAAGSGQDMKPDTQLMRRPTRGRGRGKVIVPRGPDQAAGGHWAGRADSDKHGRTAHTCLMGDLNNEVPNRGVTVRREWLESVGRETGRDGGCRLQYARERERPFILMSEFFASFVTGSVGIPVETRGIRWFVFLVAPPPPLLKWGSFAASAFKPRYGNDPEY